jgi:hypothetical protein
MQCVGVLIRPPHLCCFIRSVPFLSLLWEAKIEVVKSLETGSLAPGLAEPCRGRPFERSSTSIEMARLSIRRLVR